MMTFDAFCDVFELMDIQGAAKKVAP